MQPQETEYMLNFPYFKKSAEICAKAKLKKALLETKVGTRKDRIAKTMKEFEISDKEWSMILTQLRNAEQNRSQLSNVTYKVASSTSSSTEEERQVSAGVINNILTEEKFIASETEEVKKLEVVIRNLVDVQDPEGKWQGHHLSHDELVYLGF